MKRRTLFFGLAPALLTALCLTATASAGGFRPAPTHFQALPFKADVVFVTRSVEPTSPTTLTVGLTASGNATHLGAFQGVGTVLVDLTVPASVQYFTWTAANGDTVSGRVFILLPSAAPTVATVNGAFTIDRGTGRFKGVVGWGRVVGHLNPVTGVEPFRFAGIILRPVKK